MRKLSNHPLGNQTRLPERDLFYPGADRFWDLHLLPGTDLFYVFGHGDYSAGNHFHQTLETFRIIPQTTKQVDYSALGMDRIACI